MTDSDEQRLFANVARSRTWQTIIGIALDLAVTLVLLAALSMVHYALGFTAATDNFKQWFTQVHEISFLGMYVLVAFKGLIRIYRT